MAFIKRIAALELHAGRQGFLSASACVASQMNSQQLRETLKTNFATLLNVAPQTSGMMKTQFYTPKV